MKRSNYTITLDIRNSSDDYLLDMKQTDTHRRLYIKFTEGGEPYPVTGDCYAVFTAKKPDGTVIYNPCTLEDGTVIYDITPQTTAEPGLLACEIRLMSAAEPMTMDDRGNTSPVEAQLLTSAAFGIQIHPTVYNENDTLASETEVSALSQAMVEALETARSLQEARENGEFNGRSVSHSWNGTQLTLTSASGTTVTELRGPQGEKGDRGEKGEKGDAGEAAVDDTLAGDKAWSGKAIVERLSPVLNTQGGVVQCHPVAGSLLQVTVNSDRSAKVTICGKNLYDSQTYPLISGKLIRHAHGTFAESELYCATEAYIPVTAFRGQTITLGNAPALTNGGTTGAGMAFYDGEKGYLSGSNKAQNVVPEKAVYMRFSINLSYMDQAQLELGSEATAYEPFRGESMEADPVEILSIPGRQGLNTLFAHGRSDMETEVTLLVAGREDPGYVIGKLVDAVRGLGGDV